MKTPSNKKRPSEIKALLVGINAYPGCPLRGCVNDVFDMADFITQRWGFPKDSVRLLTDGRATAGAMLDRLHWLVGDARPGDTLLFHYSGHGTQVPDRNHDGELDGLDEAICPVDFDFDKRQTILTDDVLHVIFKTVPKGVNFLWVSDSCHSGDLTSRSFLNTSTARAYPLHPDIRWRRDGWAEKLKRNPQGGKQKPDRGGLNLAFISGCRADQTSADAKIKGRYNGAMTYHLLANLRKWEKASDSLHPSDRRLLQIVKDTTRDLRSGGFSQTPSLDGMGIENFMFRPVKP